MAEVAGKLNTIGNFVGGKHVPGSGNRLQDVYNPATGQVIGQVQLAEQEDIDQVVAVARKAAETWSQVSLTKRTKILFSMREKLAAKADDIAAVITSEHGKVFDDAQGEIGRALEAVEFVCGIVEHLK